MILFVVYLGKWSSERTIRNGPSVPELWLQMIRPSSGDLNADSSWGRDIKVCPLTEQKRPLILNIHSVQKLHFKEAISFCKIFNLFYFPDADKKRVCHSNLKTSEDENIVKFLVTRDEWKHKHTWSWISLTQTTIIEQEQTKVERQIHNQSFCF